MLNDYPELKAWYEQRRAMPGHPQTASEEFALRICEGMAHEGSCLVKACIAAFSDLRINGSDMLKEFLAVESFFQNHEVALLEVMGEMAELAIKEGLAGVFQRTMQDSAEVTGLVVFRFLSAWTALNAGEHDVCIEECEKVDEPHGSLYTLHGQALLEGGRAKEAIEVLNVATRLTPGEILAWFQLAKAYHVMKNQAEAWNALTQCRHLAPQSAEVALFMGRVALEINERSAQHDDAFAAMRPVVGTYRDNATVACTAFRLACKLEDRTKLNEVIAKMQWRAFLNERHFLNELPGMLRQLQTLEWFDAAKSLLDQITPAP